MPKINIFGILKKAVEYTKNHKFIWFFGFFLTGGGIFNFYRLVVLRHFSKVLHNFWQLLGADPTYMSLFVAGIILGLLLTFVVIGICRAVLIQATVKLERKDPKPLTFLGLIRQSAKYMWKIAAISFASNAFTVVLFFWLFAPIFYLLHQGLHTRAFPLALIATVIFLPLFIIISLVNIFAANFVAAFDLNFRAALRSAFDLLIRFWDWAVPLLFMLFAVYFLLFFLSADLISLVGILALGLPVLIKSLSAGVIFGLVCCLIAALLIVNAALNVFANIAWTLFFLEIVKASKIPEDPVLAPAPEPVVQH